MADGAPAVSVVVPVHDEEGNIAPLLAEIAEAFPPSLGHEVLVVDDASADGTLAEARAAAREDGRVRVLRHRRRAGQSAALLTGARQARAPWIATLDGDGQNDPRDLARIVSSLLDGGIEADLVKGRRSRRHEGLRKRVSSRLANRLLKWLFRDQVSDRGCGVSVIRREMLLRLPAFATMHRFLAILVLREGGAVAEREITDRPRRRGRSKYGILDRLLVTVPDTLGVLWLRRRACAVEVADEDDRRDARAP